MANSYKVTTSELITDLLREPSRKRSQPKMNFYTVPKNADVVAAWTRGATANTAHLSTDGHDLHSYALRIGTTTPKGRKIVGQFDASNEYHSMTTSHHVGIARRVADAVVEPETIRGLK